MEIRLATITAGLAFALAIPAFSASLEATAADANSTDLEARIARLESRLALQEKALVKLQQENDKLKALCRQAGIAVDVAPADAKPTPSGEVMYLGKPRTQAWLGTMYKRFGDRLVKIDDKYVCINAADIKPLDNIAYAPGTAVLAENCTVLAVIGPGEAVLAVSPVQQLPPARTRTPVVVPHPILFHVSGIRSAIVDRQAIDVSPYMVSNGTYEYGKLGNNKTLPSFVMQPTLTKDEFVAALASGATLVDYKVISGRVEAIPIK
jgi:hypothetical protein